MIAYHAEIGKKELTCVNSFKLQVQGDEKLAQEI